MILPTARTDTASDAPPSTLPGTARAWTRPRPSGDRLPTHPVDEYQLVVHPVILGGGTLFFPHLERPAGLRLLETRTFSSGVVYLGFAAR